MVFLVVGMLVVVLGYDVVALEVLIFVVDNVGVVVVCDVDISNVVVLAGGMCVVVLGSDIVA